MNLELDQAQVRDAAAETTFAVAGAQNGDTVLVLLGKLLKKMTGGVTNALATADAGPAWTTVRGVSGAQFSSADASGAAASVTDAPTTGQKLVLTDVIVSTDTAMRVDLKEETSGTVVVSLYLGANSTVNLVTRGKLKLAAADKKLQVQTSVAGNVRVQTLYYSEA